MKIAIIGSGISGMAVAYLLHEQHAITVYEKESYTGGHSRTLEAKTPQGTVAVDTGFIVFNNRNYPNLTALFEHLDVPVAKSSMSFGVSIDDGWLEYGTQNPAHIIAQKGNLLRKDFYRMVRDILRFNRKAKAFAASNPHASMEQCLHELGMGDWFTRYYLLAMGGAIWSTPLTQMLRFPAQTMIRFFENHGLLSLNDRPQWYTVKGGSREYVARLTDAFGDKIHLNRGATSVARSAASVQVTDVNGNTTHYDAVIFACHSDQALHLITNPTNAEQEILGNIRYQPNRVILHSDTRFMPKRKNAWSSWVYLCQGRDDPDPAISLSYWMNNLQPLGTDYPMIVTLNPSHAPTPELIHNEHVFDHPLFDHRAIAAQERVDEIQGTNGLWFCGAWQRYGFHEDGLSSAVAVAQKLGVRIPWAS